MTLFARHLAIVVVLLLSQSVAIAAPELDFGQIKLQLQSADPKTRTLGCENLATAESEADVKQAVQLLGQQLQIDKTAGVRVAACKALGQHGVSARSELVKLLTATEDSDAGVVSAATTALSLCGSPEKNQISEIARILASSKIAGTRQLAANLLGNSGTWAQPALARLFATLADKQASVRKSAEVAISKIGANPGHIGLLIDQLQLNKPETARRLSIQLLSRLGEAAALAIPALENSASKDPSPALQLAAKSCLAQLKVTAAAKVSARQLASLKDQLKSREADARRAALIKLGQMGPKARALIFDVLEALTDNYSSVSNAADVAYQLIGVNVNQLPKLRRFLLSAGSSSQRVAALKLMQTLKSAALPALPEVLKSLSDNYSTVTTEARRTLAAVKPFTTAQIPVFVAALDSNYNEIRQLALDNLRPFGAKVRQYQPKFLQLTNDNYSNVASAATQTVNAVGFDVSQIPQLRKLAVKGQYHNVRLIAIQQLQSFGAEAHSALGELLQATLDNYSSVSSAAEAAIFKINPTHKSNHSLILRSLNASTSGVRLIAIKLVQRAGMKSPKTLKKLIDLLADNYSSVSTAARGAIEGFKPFKQAHIPVFVACLDSDYNEVRQLGLDNLRPFGAKVRQYQPKFLQLTNDNYSNVASAATQTVNAVGFDVSQIPQLRKLVVKGQYHNVRLIAIQQLQSFGPRAHSALGEMLQATSDNYSSVSSAAEAAIYKINPTHKSNHNLILKSFDASTSTVRRIAIELAVKAQFSSPETLEALLKRLSDNYSSVSSVADKALRNFPLNGPNQAELLPVLARAANGELSSSRKMALILIAKLGPKAKSLRPTVFKRLVDNYSSVSSQAALTLKALGPITDDDIPWIEQMVNANRSTLRKEAIQLLASRGRSARASFFVIFPRMADNYSSVSTVATKACLSIGVSLDMAPKLARQCQANRSTLRKYACIFFASLGPAAHGYTKDILPLVADNYSSVSSEAKKTLAIISPTRAEIPVLLAGLRSNRSTIRETSLTYLGKLSEHCQSHIFTIIPLVADSYSRVQAAANKTINKIQLQPTMIPGFMSNLSDDHAAVRRVGLRLLAKFPTHVTPAQLPIDKLNLDYRSVRLELLKTLVSLGDKNWTSLIQLIDQLNKNDSESMIAALEKLGAAPNADRLCSFIIDALSHKDVAVRVAALKVLNKMVLSERVLVWSLRQHKNAARWALSRFSMFNSVTPETLKVLEVYQSSDKALTKEARDLHRRFSQGKQEGPF